MQAAQTTTNNVPFAPLCHHPHNPRPQTHHHATKATPTLFGATFVTTIHPKHIATHANGPFAFAASLTKYKVPTHNTSPESIHILVCTATPDVRDVSSYFHLQLTSTFHFPSSHFNFRFGHGSSSLLAPAALTLLARLPPSDSPGMGCAFCTLHFRVGCPSCNF